MTGALFAISPPAEPACDRGGLDMGYIRNLWEPAGDGGDSLDMGDIRNTYLWVPFAARETSGRSARRVSPLWAASPWPRQ